ncbi:MAG TPA: glycosyltransferase [Gemmatimonadaceae bacterium]|nr:glycosyltransferase [Gemmatimonadaceae bacterium]
MLTRTPMPDILHVPYTYFPDSAGGTETYVAALIRGLRRQGVTSAVASPVDRGQPREYVHDGAAVYRFESSGSRLPLEAQYGDGDPVAAEAFAALLRTRRPRLVHLHGWTSGISLRMLRAAHDAGMPVVHTYHTPSVSCARGTLMLYGRDVCDGQLFVDRCTRCVLQQRGVPLPISAVLGQMPVAVGRAMRRFELAGGPWTALRMTELIHERHRAFRSLLAEADHLVAVQDWVYELLAFLGAPPDKLSVSRLALPGFDATSDSSGGRERAPGQPVRMAYFGRLERIKGVHVAVAAVEALAGANIALDVYGAPQGREGEEYLQELRGAAARDPRVRILPPVPSTDVVDRMRDHDLVVVPSIWMETGPLVVPEALAAGVPVIGSARGGIPSFIRNGVDGQLVAPGDLGAWTAAIKRLVDEPGFLETLRSGVRPPETMDRVVDEMLDIYGRVLGEPLGTRRTWHAGCS